jgi:hypothetical protein
VKRNYKLVILISAVALLMSLLAVLPAMGADAVLRFPDPDDPDNAVVSWARQGGTVTLEVRDSDLNRPIKRVLVPGDPASWSAGRVTADLTGTGITVNTDAGSTEAVVTSGAVVPDSVEVGDTIIVDGETVREVAEINDAGTIITATAPFALSQDGAEVAEVNVPEGSFANCPDCALAVPISNNTEPNGIEWLLRLADTNVGSALVNRFPGAPDSALNINDIRIVRDDLVDSNAKVTGLDLGLGTLTTDGKDTSLPLNLLFWSGEVNTSAALGVGSVTVTSGIDPTGFVVTLTETGPSSGVFRAEIDLIAGVSVPGTSLRVNTSDTLRMTYSDGTTAARIARTSSIRIETTPPSFANFDPAEAYATTNNLPTVKADATDGDSGVVDTSVQVIWAVDTHEAMNDVPVTSAVVEQDVTTIVGGVSLVQRFPSADALNTDHVIYWWVKVTDAAGNIGISDRLPLSSATSTTGFLDTCDVAAFLDINRATIMDFTDGVAFCQPYSIRVDRTSADLLAAVVGSWWDSSKTTDDKTETDVALADPEFIRLDFDGPVDGNSIARTDFRVDGVTPLDVFHFSGRAQSVFLMVPAQAANARPKIEIVSAVLDLAGNELKSDVVDPSTDGIAPTIGATPGSGDRPVTNDSISIAVTANEDSTSVVLTVGRIEDQSLVPSSSVVTVSGGPQSWTATRSFSIPGVYNVFTQATDLNSATNVGSVGLAQTGPVFLTSTDSVAVLFEVDTGIPAPGFLPATDTDDPNAFLSADFVNEGLEYGLKADGDFTTDPADVALGTDFDSYGTVILVSAELDDVDITSEISTTDNVRLLYKASGLNDGAHTLVITVQDLAGNEAEFTHTFSVVERAPLAIPLVPGWNLVSFPGSPADPAIDSVFPATVPVTVVMAFDAGQQLWLTATRERDSEGNLGPFSGNLTTINPNWGYWVLTDTFQPISTLIPRTTGGATLGQTPVQPPSIILVIGWNLVPILDPTGDRTPGGVGVLGPLAPDDYFSGVTADISRIYDFNTLTGRWVPVELNATPTLAIGKAYWVFMTAAGTVTP